MELLKIDGRFYRFYGDILALDREAGLIPSEVAVWDELTARQLGSAKGADATEAVQLQQQVADLAPLAKGDPEMEDRVSDLMSAVRRAARPVSTSGGPFAR